MSADWTIPELNAALVDARRIAQRLASRAGTLEDVDDIAQDLLLELLSRLKYFRQSRGSFGSFANVVMHHGAARIVAKIRRHREHLGYLPNSSGQAADWDWQDVLSEDQGLSALYGQTFNRIEQIETRIGVEQALAHLDEEPRRLALALADRSVDQLAADGVAARSTLYRRVHELRSRLLTLGIQGASQ